MRGSAVLLVGLLAGAAWSGHAKAADLRRIMKAKGLTDAQIDLQFASTQDPLEAAKTFVHDGADIDQVKRTVEFNPATQPVQREIELSPEARSQAIDLIASLKATGVVANDPLPTDAPHHGVAVQQAGVDAGTRTV